MDGRVWNSETFKHLILLLLLLLLLAFPVQAGSDRCKLTFQTTEEEEEEDGKPLLQRSGQMLRQRLFYQRQSDISTLSEGFSLQKKIKPHCSTPEQLRQAAEEW